MDGQVDQAAVGARDPVAACFAVTALSLGLAFALPGHIELIAVIFVANLPVRRAAWLLSFMPHGWAACLAESTYLRD